MTLRGNLGVLTYPVIGGWARDPAGDTPVSLVIAADGEVLGRVLADRYREHLKRSQGGDGRYGFELRLGAQLSPLVRHVITVRREADGAHIPGSPAVLEAATAFDAAVQASLAQLLSASAGDGDLERRYVFLGEQMERLRQLHAGQRGGRLERDEVSDGVDAAPRALFIDDTPPVTSRDAASHAILSHMLSLRRIGFEVSFVASDLAKSAELDAAGIECHAKPWYGSVEEVLTRERGGFDLVYLHRASNGGRYADLVRHYQPGAFLVYGVAYLHSLRLARQAKVEAKPALERLSRNSQAIETMAAWHANLVITHSIFEADLLRQRLPPAKVHVVPWAIPLRPAAAYVTERQGIAFIGAFDQAPNVAAARWLIEAVMPELDQLDPMIGCLIVGSDMPDSLRDLARGQVEAVGAVPDLADLFERIRVTVAPLSYGAGIKGTVLESMAAGVPCVCTPAAVEGLDLPQLLLDQVASAPADLAAKIERLHNDVALNDACAEAGLAYIGQHASEFTIDRLMRAAIGPVLERLFRLES